MKSWTKAVIWLLIIYAIVIHVYIAHNNNSRNEVKSFTPGPTCNTYYYGRDLRVCPQGLEFNVYLQDCVLIDGDGDGCHVNVVNKNYNLYDKIKSLKNQVYKYRTSAQMLQYNKDDNVVVIKED
ncbi:unknown protein [Spodoptera frugiperda multiple nucleopolyhedrovirus]|uniref:Sf95 n=1 Tax=Spodoptera frugiperda nuclear polyhedrosis virus TaxID=10455 RepID=A1YJ85_NPVSF|nr:hypothetical protein SFMNPV_gp095 [Spodoptera frugiperda multiple nucleopolyhedrovirus]ABM45805.1 unknown protein [Spodoptera frugiperda multiple nucleopolyhedrovirus]ADV91328.1 hypothetical protein Sf95 [Spodoptera frugiperda multiple nucleopolyhedrovirus]AFH59039.1 hypothetical protein Sf95 [Spodoptera frugiperda multiple nucleopolyhedrovirus]AIW01506.1 hypothetical protein [Spodoptera frugiperda multiple nucleopolyhedrovirus]QED40008.1 hypothetical protein [Spodoptera frugiperda multiple